MAQQSPNPAVAIINSPPDSGFVPRKEFIREQKATPNSFAILTLSSSSLVRLYSFPPSVIAALRAFLEASASLAAFREDFQLHFCEYVLNGKPWASPKNVNSEKLLIDILAIIYQCGYTYLSTLDYGRESDDRLAMAFSIPSTSASVGSRSATPLPPNPAPFRDSSTSITSDRHRSRRSPFALSFLSPTLMRVISPPLHLTPAILQAVRASWPRGVVSEKNVGDNSFEFKLKGYKWFQQDTFATDSLRHILSLLTSLDSQAFTLLSSISLTNRSRVKDLWVFTGPGSIPGDDLIRQESALNESNSDARAYLTETAGQSSQSPGPDPLSRHRRLASEPARSLVHAPPHIRAATEQGSASKFSMTHGYRTEYPSMGPALLRKPAPRAQIPVSVVHEADPPGTNGLRAHLPSTISSGVEDMTGIGASGFTPQKFYASPEGKTRTDVLPSSRPPHSPPRSRSVTPPGHGRSPLRPVANRQKTPPLLTSNTLATTGGQESSTPGLLGPGTFRDSAVSTVSDASFDIPIKWVGIQEAMAQQEEANALQQFDGAGSNSRRRVSSVGAMIPGGWQPTPIEEKPESVAGFGNDDSTPEDENTGAKTPIHEVASRVASPELTRPDLPLRKSEAALVGLISETSRPPLPTGSGTASTSSGKGQGWVLVNVGDSSNRSGEPSPHTNSPLLGSSGYPPPPPHARAIVVIDALDSKNKGKDKLEVISPPKKRFFNIGRKNSTKGTPGNIKPQPTTETESVKARPGFRDKLRLKSTAEAARKENKRRSMD